MRSVRQEITAAYAVFKRRPPDELFIAPRAQHTPVKAKPRRVKRSADKSTVLETPPPETRAKQSRGGTVSSNGRIVSGLTAGKVIAAVESQPFIRRTWLQFAYVDEIDSKRASGHLAAYLHAEAQESTPPLTEGKTAKTLARYKLLTFVALVDARHRYNAGTALYTDADIARYLRLTDSKNYRRQFGRIWSYYAHVIDRLDREGLRAVGSMISEG